MKLTCVATPHCMDSLFWISKKSHLAENMLAVTQDGWMGPFNSCKLCGLSIQEIMQASMVDNRPNWLSSGHINEALKGAGSLYNPKSLAKTVYKFGQILRTGTPQMLELECFPEGPDQAQTAICNGNASSAIPRKKLTRRPCPGRRQPTLL